MKLKVPILLKMSPFYFGTFKTLTLGGDFQNILGHWKFFCALVFFVICSYLFKPDHGHHHLRYLSCFSERSKPQHTEQSQRETVQNSAAFKNKQVSRHLHLRADTERHDC